MTTALRSPRSAAADRPRPDGRARALPRRGDLPNGRALGGALLVVVAVLGLLAAYQSSTRIRTTDYLVARRAIPAGRAIRADDLALAPMVLHHDVAADSFERPHDLIGQVALIPITRGALVERHAVAHSVPARPGRRLSLQLEPAQALNGRLETGERVDVVSTPTGSAPASIIQRGALVSAVDGLGDTDSGNVGGSSARVTVTLVVPDEDAARLIVDARAHGTVTLIASSAALVDEADETTSPSTSAPATTDPTTTAAPTDVTPSTGP